MTKFGDLVLLGRSCYWGLFISCFGLACLFEKLFYEF